MVKEENLPKFFSLYAKWLDNIYLNLKSTTGYAVRLDWSAG
jgi:hypothetical protein